VTVGVRIASGTTGSSASSTGNPVSQNQTLGNAYFGRNPVGLDLAYIRLAPTNWLSVSGGRVANPWFSTDLLWAPDLSFDGFTSTARPKFSENTSGFATLGAFPLQHFDPNPLNNSAGNKWLYGAQLGLDHHTADKSRVRVGLALYDYVHAEGIANTGAAGSVQATLFNQTAPQFLQKGNTLFPINVFGDAPLFGLASRFKEINLTGEIDFARFDPVHVIVTGDYVKNIGFKSGEILQRTGQALNGRTTGYQGKVMVGWPRIEKQGQWQLFGSYKYVERDAVLDAFTETDFHLGGTDARGYVIGGSYGIARNTWVSLRWASSNSIDLPPLAVDLLQVDLNARF
jgi:hypothetical protein